MGEHSNFVQALNYLEAVYRRPLEHKEVTILLYLYEQRNEGVSGCGYTDLDTLSQELDFDSIGIIKALKGLGTEYAGIEGPSTVFVDCYIEGGEHMAYLTECGIEVVKKYYSMLTQEGKPYEQTPKTYKK